MQSLSTAECLADWLREILASGLRIDESLQRFLEATYGASDLAAVLADGADSQTDSLLELLFFPDVTLQRDYEVRWGATVFSTAQQKAVVARLQKCPLLAAIHGPANAAPVRIAAPAFALEALVQRLNITWQPHPRLARALEAHLAPPQSIAVRVHLRNAPLAWHANQVDLAALFLARMASAEKTYLQDLAFLLSLLGELGPAQPQAEFLIDKKGFCFQALCKAEAFERQRQASNMEILILQGARASHGDIAQWREQMLRIDRICRSLFGRTQFFQEPMEHRVSLSGQSAQQDMGDLLALLS